MISKSKQIWLSSLYSYTLFDDELQVTQNPKQAEWVTVPLLEYSDYSGSLVCKSNIQTIKDQLEMTETVLGHYGYEALLLPLLGLSYKETVGYINALAAYPALDDANLSELEYTSAYDAWIQSGHDDFLHHFKDSLWFNLIDDELDYDALIWPRLSKYRTRLLWGAMNPHGEYFVNEQGDQIYFPFYQRSRGRNCDELVIDAMWELDLKPMSCPLACPIDPYLYASFQQLEFKF